MPQGLDIFLRGSLIWMQLWMIDFQLSFPFIVWITHLEQRALVFLRYPIIWKTHEYLNKSPSLPIENSLFLADLPRKNPPITSPFVDTYNRWNPDKTNNIQVWKLEFLNKYKKWL